MKTYSDDMMTPRITMIMVMATITAMAMVMTMAMGIMMQECDQNQDSSGIVAKSSDKI
ncbi:MAG: hypothetical protein ACLS36_02495 [Streptococcus sp.]